MLSLFAISQLSQTIHKSKTIGHPFFFEYMLWITKYQDRPLKTENPGFCELTRDVLVVNEGQRFFEER